ncbi:MAG: rod shape-determining protein MreD [Dethiobacteria bacterium]
MLFYIILVVVSLFIIFAQGSFFSFFLVGQAQPDILLIIVIIIGFLLREKKGAAIGLCLGLIQDFIFVRTLGFFALSKMLLGFAAGLAGREIYRNRIVNSLILVFTGTIIHEFLIFILVYFFIGAVNFEWLMLKQFAIKAVYNSLLTLLLYPFFFWLLREKNILSVED